MELFLRPRRPKCLLYSSLRIIIFRLKLTLFWNGLDVLDRKVGALHLLHIFFFVLFDAIRQLNLPYTRNIFFIFSRPQPIEIKCKWSFGFLYEKSFHCICTEQWCNKGVRWTVILIYTSQLSVWNLSSFWKSKNSVFPSKIFFLQLIRQYLHQDYFSKSNISNSMNVPRFPTVLLLRYDILLH